ncbi:MAG TPA: CAP domain-containing protein [Patescibacteria group bacterium]
MNLNPAHFFIPRHSNGHKAKILHSTSIFFIVLTLLSVQIAVNFAAKKGLVLGFAANISPSEVIRLTNLKRQENGLSPLVENKTLDQAALAKGTDMINKGYWAHVSPDGIQPWKFFGDFGYDYRYAGENLARDFSDPASAVDAWMASSSHRENMLSSKYREIGIGVVDGKLAGVDTTIIVQFFGTKMADTIPVQPVAKAEPTVAPIVGQVKAATPLPTVNPTVLPTATPAVAATSPQLQVSPFNITRSISLGVISVLIIALVVDTFVIEKKRLVRAGGRAYAHFAFLGMILAILIIAKVGQIL